MATALNAVAFFCLVSVRFVRYARRAKHTFRQTHRTNTRYANARYINASRT